MDVSFSSPQLRALDGVMADAFALPWFEGEFPCRGTLGMVDWRLGGWLSKQFEEKERLGSKDHWIIGLSGKFAVPRLLLFGMGPVTEFSEQVFMESLRSMASAAKKARFRRLAVELPGRAHALISPSRAVELVFRDPSISLLLDDMVLIDEPVAQTEIESKIHSLKAGQRRRSQAPLPD